MTDLLAAAEFSPYAPFIDKVRARCGQKAMSPAAFRQLLLQEDWVAPAWPASAGGPGWTREQIWIFFYLTSALPVINPTALEQVAPLLIQDGARGWRGLLQDMLSLPGQDWATGWCRPAPVRLPARVTSSTPDPQQVLLLMQTETCIEAGVADMSACRLLHSCEAGGQFIFSLEVPESVFRKHPLTPIQDRRQLLQILVQGGRPGSTRAARLLQVLQQWQQQWQQIDSSSAAFRQLQVDLLALQATEIRCADLDRQLLCHLRALELTAEALRLLQSAAAYSSLIQPDPARHNLIQPHPLAEFLDPFAGAVLPLAPDLAPELIKDLLATAKL